jgi:hypothetical protein
MSEYIAGIITVVIAGSVIFMAITINTSAYRNAIAKNSPIVINNEVYRCEKEAVK